MEELRLIFARVLERHSGAWEVLSDGRPCATVDGVKWYWCALRRIGHWRVYSGAMCVAPDASLEELAPHLFELVEQCRRIW